VDKRFHNLVHHIMGEATTCFWLDMCLPASWKQMYAKIIQFGYLFLVEGSSVVCVKAGI